MTIVQPGRYRFRSPDRSLESWAGAHIDLWTAQDMFELCLETKGMQREACWTAGLIRYERAFSQTHWPAHSEVISKLNNEQLVTHYFLRYLRNNMFTHRLGVGDNYEIIAVVQPDALDRLSIVGVMPINWRIASLGDELASDFVELLKVVRALETEAFERAKVARLNESRAETMDDILKSTILNPQAIDIWPKKSDPRFLSWMESKISKKSSQPASLTEEP